ncbi:hypothetical protein [uncultured Methanobrevibacter sp.]|uniref:hypothetical protein n=1 Tax=uncultured Methanobrevibacter sp. TaxID=253161 RepID=UPI0025FA7D9D|nr:hypothetical protein [uncultured Methanobrevibacter sp.]
MIKSLSFAILMVVLNASSIKSEYSTLNHAIVRYDDFFIATRYIYAISVRVFLSIFS